MASSPSWTLNDISIIAIHPYVNPLHPDYSGLATAIDMLTPLFTRYAAAPYRQRSRLE
jgi:hypothetical protein